MLRPELERIDGFVDNIRYRSLTREGWILSLSGWRDEKALVRWRHGVRHHVVQEKGRSRDPARLPPARRPAHARHAPARTATRCASSASTRPRPAKATTITPDRRPAAGRDWVAVEPARGRADCLALPATRPGLVGWDVFDAVLAPGDLILLASWRDRGGRRGVREPRRAARRARACAGARRARLRHVRPARGAAILPRCQAG